MSTALSTVGPPAARAADTVVRTIDEDTFWPFLAVSPYASLQQTPQWGRARSAEWDSEMLGWFDGDDRLRGVTAVRYRSLPMLSRTFAYISFGPVIDWEHGDIPDLLDALSRHLRERRVFAVRMVPPLTLHSWGSEAIKSAIQDDGLTRLAQVRPEGTDELGCRAAFALEQCGWRRQDQSEVEDGQSLYNVWLPLADVTESDLRARMNSSWRRNIRLAERNGVEVVEGTRDDLPAVKQMYDETAERLGFGSHPLEFFESIWDAFSDRFPGVFRLHLARHEGEAISAILTVQTGCRAQALLIANSSHKRQLRASNLLYEAVVRQARADGARFYDFGGVGGAVEEGTADAGLLRFKASMGGVTQEYLGSWDLPLNRLLYVGFMILLPLYSRVRSRVGRRAGRSTRTASRRSGHVRT